MEPTSADGSLTAPGGAVVSVSLENVYSLTLETRDTGRILLERVGALVDNHKDHENRLRSLERKVWWAAGLAAGAGAGISQFLNSGGGG